MAKLIAHWPYKCVPCQPWMLFRNGDRVRHMLGPVGTIQGYEFHNPLFFYVLYDGARAASRIHAGSLELVHADRERN